jgi:hypothetical protein
VVCPKCLRRYRVPWSKIPKQGAWVTCPACRERFIIKLEDEGFLDFQPQASNSPGPKSPGGSLSKSLSHRGGGPGNYLYRPGEDAPGELLVTMLDPVTPKARRYWSVALIATLLIVFGVEAAILRSSYMSARDMGAEAASAPPPPPVYDEAALAADLRAIQQATVSAVRLDRLIEYTGGESRVFKHAAAILAPESCSQITSLFMRSASPAQGLSLKASCLDPGEASASLEIAWNGRYAELFLSGQDRLRRINVLLHQPSPEVAAAMATAAAEAEAAARSAAEEDD